MLNHKTNTTQKLLNFTTRPQFQRKANTFYRLNWLEQTKIAVDFITNE